MSKGNKPGKQPNMEHVLRGLGYKYKLLCLTPEERDEYENGRREYDERVKREVKKVPREFDYWFKIVEGVEVRILKAGPDFYYNGGRVTSKEQISKIEKYAQQEKVYADLAAQVQDTIPITSVIEAEKVDPATFDTSKIPEGYILLMGGPLENTKVEWRLKSMFYIAQVADAAGRTAAYRYTRDKKMEAAGASDRIYHFEMQL